MLNRLFILGATTLLASCSPQPNHVGNPVLLPVKAVQSGASNFIYGAKRAKVARFVRENFAAIKKDSLGQGGPTERAAMDLAGVPLDKQFKLHKELQGDPELYFGADQEPLVVALMVHGV